MDLLVVRGGLRIRYTRLVSIIVTVLVRIRVVVTTAGAVLPLLALRFACRSYLLVFGSEKLSGDHISEGQLVRKLINLALFKIIDYLGPPLVESRLHTLRVIQLRVHLTKLGPLFCLGWFEEVEDVLFLRAFDLISTMIIEPPLQALGIMSLRGLQ